MEFFAAHSGMLHCSARHDVSLLLAELRLGKRERVWRKVLWKSFKGIWGQA